MSAEICEEYASTLKDLTFNSKPHISMLTMLAEENSQFAPQIVKVVEAHLQKVKPECKLPTLYLIDSIMKNVGNAYQSLFTQNIVSNFCSVFEKVDEKIRAQMYKLRQTWAEIFPNKKLYAIDIRVKQLDPAWPILAKAPQMPSIHVNPRFLPPPTPESKPKPAIIANQELQEEEMRKQLLAKQQELLKLQRQKLELELLQTQVLVEEQKRQLIIKEQQMRVQQTIPTEIPKSFALQQHQMNNAVALTASTSQASLTTGVDRVTKKAVPVHPTSTSVGASLEKRPDLVSVGAVDSTKPVISSFVANNKTFDVNTHAKPSIANVFPSKTESVPSSVQKSSQGKANSSGAAMQTTVASVAKSAGRSSLASILIKPQSTNLASTDPRLRNRDPARSASGETPNKNSHNARSSQKNILKQSPKKSIEKGESSLGTKLGGKDSAACVSPKKRTQSPKKNKIKVESSNMVDKKFSKVSDEGGSSQSKKDGEKPTPEQPGGPSSQAKPLKDKEKGGRVKGMSPVPGGRSAGGRKGGRYIASSRDGRQSSHSRSRSPGHAEKGRSERLQTVNKRSPRKEKENDSKGADGKNQEQSFKDVDLRTTSNQPGDKSQKHGLEQDIGTAGGSSKLSDDEPPLKKSKGSDDSELDEIFGGKDQDYRQLMRPVPKLSPIGNEHQGWAQYKASRPDEFKNTPLRPRDNVGDPFGFGRQDLDLRQGGSGIPNSPSPVGPLTPRLGGPFSPGIGRDMRDPRINRAGDGPGRNYDSPGLRFPRSDPRSRGTYYQATRESNPSIPRALMFDRGAEIMRQADLQLRNGQLTVDQHCEIMEQLAKLFELQRMQHVQREQRLGDTVVQRGGGFSGRRGRYQGGYQQEQPDTIVLSSENSSQSDGEDMDIDERHQNRRHTKVKLLGKGQRSPSMREKFLKPSEGDDGEAPSRMEGREDRKSKGVDHESEATGSPRMDRDERKKDLSQTRSLEMENIDLPSTLDIEMNKSSSFDNLGKSVNDETPKPNKHLTKGGAKVKGRGIPSDSQARGSPKLANRDVPVNTVMIDDKPREVLFLGENAIVLLGEDDNDPRMIAFRGPPQDVTFDGEDDKCVVRLGFMPHDLKEFELAGHRHAVRFGAPTREVLIDGQPYSAIFGGPPFVVALNGRPYHVRLCGPTPEVYFGDETRHDLLALIRDSNDTVPATLRASDERDVLPSAKHSLAQKESKSSPVRWVTSTIGRDYDPREWKLDHQLESREEPNRFAPRQPFGRGRGGDWKKAGGFQEEPLFHHERGRPFRGDSRRGGRGNQHNQQLHREFRDFEPPWGGRGSRGERMDEQMRHDDFHPGGPPRGGGQPPPHHHLRADRLAGRRGSPIMDEFYERDARNNSPYRDVPDERSSNFFPDPRFVQHGGPGPQGMPSGNMNVHHNRFDGPNLRMGGPLAPRSMGAPLPPQVPQSHHPGIRFNGPPPLPYGFPGGGPPNPNFPPPPMHQQEFGFPGGRPPHMMPGMNHHGFPPCPPIPPQMDVTSLFEKLVATGIIPHVSNSQEKVEDQDSMDGPPIVLDAASKSVPPPEEIIPPIALTNESLRTKYPGVVASLYFGIQCSSCGVRFTSEQTDKYAQHLDWHFRQNRREKDSVRKALSRKWHYIVQDWIQFEEIEDLEERARSFFELQANEDQGEGGEDINSSVAAGENEDDKKCVVCHESFELYWDEEHEEWHFRDAVRHDEKNYHPLCYEDYKEQMIKAAVEEEKARLLAESEKVAAAIKKEQEDALAAEALLAVKKVEPEEDAGVISVAEELIVPIKLEPVADGSVAASEPMDAEEQTNQLQEPMEVQEMSVFNVLAKSYSVPPLIGLDLEEKETPMDVDGIKVEPVDDIKPEPVGVVDLGNPELGSETTSKDNVPLKNVGEFKKELNDGQESAVDYENSHNNENHSDNLQSCTVADDALPSTDNIISSPVRVEEITRVDDVNELGPLPRRELEATQQDENDLCSATQLITIKQEPIESDEREFSVGSIAFCEAEDDDCDVAAANVLQSLVSEVCCDVANDESSSSALEVVRNAEDVIKVDELVSAGDALHGEIVEKITWGTTDVLAESSAGETSDAPGDPTAKFDDAEESEDSDEENSELPKIVDGFTVLPPVNIGTELSGLCTIL